MSHSSRGAIAVLAATIVLAVALPMQASAVSQATVSGTVVGTDDVPIPDAAVEVSRLDEEAGYLPVATLGTDDGGQWSYAGKAGQYEIDVSAAGAEPDSALLTVRNKQSYLLDMTLESYGTISGRVTAAGSGWLVAGATILLYARTAEGGWAETTVTAPAVDGTFVTPQIPVGQYAVFASAPGYLGAFHGGPTLADATPVDVIRAADSAGADVSLAPLVSYGEIAGAIVGADGVTGLHGYVYLYRQNADGTWPASYMRQVETSWSGTYTSGALAAGSYRVRFFTVHTGVQWWRYVATSDLATPVDITYDGQVVSGVNGWFGGPTP